MLSFSLPSSFSCSDVIVLSLYVVDWKFNLLRGEGGGESRTGFLFFFQSDVCDVGSKSTYQHLVSELIWSLSCRFLCNRC